MKRSSEKATGTGVTIVAVVLAKPGHEQEVGDILKAAVPPSRAEAGCLAYTLFRDQETPGRFVFIERWADPAALAEHEQTPHSQRLGELLPLHIESESEVIRLEPVLCSTLSRCRDYVPIPFAAVGGPEAPPKRRQ